MITEIYACTFVILFVKWLMIKLPTKKHLEIQCINLVPKGAFTRFHLSVSLHLALTHALRWRFNNRVSGHLLRTAREWFSYISSINGFQLMSFSLDGAHALLFPSTLFPIYMGIIPQDFCLTTRFLNKFRFSGSYFRKNLFSKEYNHVRNVLFSMSADRRQQSLCDNRCLRQTARNL